VDRARPVGAGLAFYEEKRRVRRVAEAAGVPYTYICCNSIAGWPYFDNTHPSEVPPPLDRFQIYGDGTVRGTSCRRLALRFVQYFCVKIRHAQCNAMQC
jgi:leucoanthocyanidin reductase